MCFGVRVKRLKVHHFLNLLRISNFLPKLRMLSSVPFTEIRRLYRTKYWTYIVTGSWRCVLLLISQLYFTAFGIDGSHSHSFLIMMCLCCLCHPWLILPMCSESSNYEQTLLPGVLSCCITYIGPIRIFFGITDTTWTC